MSFRNFSNFVIIFVLLNVLFCVIPWFYEIISKCVVFLATIYLSEWLMTCTRKHFFYKKVTSANKAVFITGCDSGFGHYLAKRLDEMGYRIFAGCYDPAGQGALDLSKNSSSRLAILPLDVTSDRSVRDAFDTIKKSLKSQEQLWAVINNAGIARGAEIDWMSMQVVQDVLEVNTVGTVRVAKAFLPLLRESNGRIINMTSMCGTFICPGFVAYCMSKSASISFTTGLRIEMKKWGIKAISIEPFFYRTPITQKEQVFILMDKMWNDAEAEVKALYGEKYKESFKESCRRLLNRSSNKVNEVIDCLEDAVTAEDPLSTYRPAFAPDKLGITILGLLPQAVTDVYLQLELGRCHKPAILCHK